MTGVYNEPLQIEEIEKCFCNDIKTFLIHHYDIYNVIEKHLIYPNNIIIG